MGITAVLRLAGFSKNKARASALSRIFRHAEKSTRRGRAHEKKFCAGSVRGRVDGLHEAQIARISANRFAAAARLPTAQRVLQSRFAFRIGALLGAHATSSRVRCDTGGNFPPLSTADRRQVFAARR
jgi:hypothetical protein